MNPAELLSRFDFKHQAIFNEQVDPKSPGQAKLLKLYVDRHLPVDLISQRNKLCGKNRFIDAFEQARAKIPVNPQRNTNHFP